MEIQQGMQENVHVFKTSERKSYDYLLISDVHFDSKDNHRDLLKKHLNEIKKRKGHVLIFGDLFDVMGTFHDPRSCWIVTGKHR